MRRFYVTCPLSWSKIKKFVGYWKLCIKSLTYNSYGSAADVAFEPVFWIVDFAVRWFGVISSWRHPSTSHYSTSSFKQAFVTLVVCLTSSVVVLFHMNVLPHVLKTHSTFCAHVHLAYGHYLLLMIVFHYFKAVTTNPGCPPAETSDVPLTSICKKCITPKPPRTHHCSVCKKCRLKMDHHCPWLNNCVGHYNHRYFISFCVFMLLGTVYVSLSSWTLFYDCFGLAQKLQDVQRSLQRIFSSSANSSQTGDAQSIRIRHALSANTCSGKDRFYNTGTVFLWILCSAVTAALGCLTAWHIFLISRGETSIEKLINDKERRRMKKLNMKFANPYDFGCLGNWKRLLGVQSLRSFVRRVLLPSTHLPDEDGILWDVANYRRTMVT